MSQSRASHDQLIHSQSLSPLAYHKDILMYSLCYLFHLILFMRAEITAAMVIDNCPQVYLSNGNAK